jgi:hypothetical protein
MSFTPRVSTNLPTHALDQILGMRKISQGQQLEPGTGAGAGTAATAPAATAPAAVAPAAAPAAAAAPAGQLPQGLLAGGGLSEGFIPSATTEAPEAKLFFKDNTISENALHGPFDVKGKKLYYPVKFNKNSQQFEYLQLARAVEAPAQ